ncbi:unnamed protein product [Caenorhabditis brenneri]
MTTKTTIHVGIDIGTTSAKICAKRGNEVISEDKQIYENDEIENGVQDPKVILKTVMELLEKVQNTLHNKNLSISDIWTCGQMHGIVFWNQESIGSLDTLTHSPLYNWTYSTSETKDFIKTLPKWNYGDAHPGFGLVTFSYIYKMDPESLKKYNRCGTIMDLFVSLLTKSSETFISHHNAHSWGYCNSDGTWQSEILEFLPNWITLPTVKRENSEVVGIWNNMKCHVASGDLQASVASLDSFENTAYIILGTSAQLCCLVNKNETTVIPSTVVKLPYSNSKDLLAACSMNGGNALESVMKMKFPNSCKKLNNLFEELNRNTPEISSDVRIDPIFIPERGITKELLFQNVDSKTSVLQILESTHNGIINNLFFLFPIPLLSQLSINRLALVGSSQCPRFRRHVEAISQQIFELTAPNSVISTPIGATNFEVV